MWRTVARSGREICNIKLKQRNKRRPHRTDTDSFEQTFYWEPLRDSISGACERSITDGPWKHRSGPVIERLLCSERQEAQSCEVVAAAASMVAECWKACGESRKQDRGAVSEQIVEWSPQVAVIAGIVAAIAAATSKLAPM